MSPKIVVKPKAGAFLPTEPPREEIRRLPAQKSIFRRIAEIVLSDIKAKLGIAERRISSAEIQRGIEDTMKMGGIK